MERLAGPSGDDVQVVETVTLDGVGVTLTWTWSGLLERWYLDVGDALGEPLVNGLQVVCNVSLWGRYRNTRAGLPGGVLIAISLSDDLSDPGQYDLADGGRVRLMYLTQEEAVAVQELQTERSELVVRAAD